MTAWLKSLGLFDDLKISIDERREHDFLALAHAGQLGLRGRRRDVLSGRLSGSMSFECRDCVRVARLSRTHTPPCELSTRAFFRSPRAPGLPLVEPRRVQTRRLLASLRVERHVRGAAQRGRRRVGAQWRSEGSIPGGDVG